MLIDAGVLHVIIDNRNDRIAAVSAHKPCTRHRWQRAGTDCPAVIEGGWAVTRSSRPVSAVSRKATCFSIPGKCFRTCRTCLFQTFKTGCTAEICSNDHLGAAQWQLPESALRGLLRGLMTS